MPPIEAPASASGHGSQLRVAQLVRPYWKTLSIAAVAVVGVTLTDILEPWPVKIVVDSVLQSKPLKGWFGEAAFRVFGHDALAVLNFAVTAVVLSPSSARSARTCRVTSPTAWASGWRTTCALRFITTSSGSRCPSIMSPVPAT